MASARRSVLDLPSPAWEHVLQLLEDEEALALPLVGRRLYACQDVAEVLVEKEGFCLELVAPSLRTKSLCCRAVRNCTGSTEDARRLFKAIKAIFAPQPDDELVWLMCLHFPPLIPEILSEEQRRHRAFLLGLLAYCEPQPLWLGKENLLQYFPALAADRGVVLKAVGVYGGNLCSASPELRRDAQVVRAALRAYGGFSCLDAIDDAMLQREGFLEEASELLQDDMWTLASYLKPPQHLELARRAARLAPIYGLRDLPRALRSDRRVWMEAVRQCPMALEFVPPEQVSLEVAAEAVQRCPRAFAVLKASSLLGRSEALALLAFSRDGMLLAHHRLNRAWRHHKRVVLACVRENGLAVEHAAEHLRDDEEVVRAAVAQNGLALAYASRKRRHQGGIVALAARQNFHALSFGLDCGHVAKRARVEQWAAPGLPAAPSCRTERCVWDHCVL